MVTALSASLIANVKRDGGHWEQRFARGKAVTKLTKAGPARGTGTTITFTPDSQIFPSTTFKLAMIRERLEARAYLHRGLTMTFENDAEGTSETFHHERGIAEYSSV